MQAKKSQITIEFLFLIGFLFIFSLGFIVVAGIQMKEFSDNKKIETILDFGDSLKKEIGIASVVKNGYEREIYLPEKIDNSINYTIITKNSTLIIKTENYEFAAIIPKTQGSLAKGKNTIKKINNSVAII